jgi:hypothetical protein
MRSIDGRKGRSGSALSGRRSCLWIRGCFGTVPDPGTSVPHRPTAIGTGRRGFRLFWIDAAHSGAAAVARPHRSFRADRGELSRTVPVPATIVEFPDHEGLTGRELVTGNRTTRRALIHSV